MYINLHSFTSSIFIYVIYLYEHMDVETQFIIISCVTAVQLNEANQLETNYYKHETLSIIMCVCLIFFPIIKFVNSTLSVIVQIFNLKKST